MNEAYRKVLKLKSFRHRDTEWWKLQNVLTYAQETRRNVKIRRKFTRKLTTRWAQKQQDTPMASFVNIVCVPVINKCGYDHQLGLRFEGRRRFI